MVGERSQSGEWNNGGIEISRPNSTIVHCPNVLPKQCNSKSAGCLEDQTVTENGTWKEFSRSIQHKHKTIIYQFCQQMCYRSFAKQTLLN